MSVLLPWQMYFTVHFSVSSLSDCYKYIDTMTGNHHFIFSGLAFLFLLSCTNIAQNTIQSPDNQQIKTKSSTYKFIEPVAKRDTSFETTHFEFHFIESFLPVSIIAKTATTLEENATFLLDFLPQKAFEGKIKYQIYSNIEQKGLALKNGRPAQVNHEKQVVYTVEGDFFQGHEEHLENELYLRKILGQTPHTFLEKGLAVFLNKTWQKKGWNEWTARLFSSANMPPLAELLNEELFEKESDLVMYTAAASFVDFYIHLKGKEDFIEHYAQLSIKKEAVTGLQNQWNTFLSNKYADFQLTQKPKELPWLKGFNFAHEGYRIYNGYGSNLALQSMQTMMDKGCNSLAIVPYSYMRSINKPSFMPIMRGAGSETDEAVIATHMQGKMQGAFTVLKPQIWMRGSWPGAIEMKNEADWAAFFDYYYRWMRHYAMVAEIWNMDMLCLGVEFAIATQSHPKEWKELIKKTKGIYTGPVTYAANWGDEFENIVFWDDLDYIGINCYYPLSGKKAPKRAELEAGFQKTIQKIEKVSRKYGKKVIFTEIGFRSIEAPWIHPHEEANGKKTNTAHQAKCYDIVFNAIKNKDWCNGILWWKWPSHLSYSRQGNKGFSPSGKEAEQVVELHFKEE